jgi:hypothetical protein
MAIRFEKWRTSRQSLSARDEDKPLKEDGGAADKSLASDW